MKPVDNPLATLRARLLDALDAHIGSDGLLHDPHPQDHPGPLDHYGHCAAALALACDRERGWRSAIRPARAWMRLSPRETGHAPFNRLLLGLLVRLGRERGDDPATLSLLGKAREGCELHDEYPSNNWSLLAQTCRLLEADNRRRARERTRLDAMLSRWTTPDGGFIDFPAHPEAGKPLATPLAYHHKALFLTALAARFDPDPVILAHLHRLLDWLVHCWDPAGYAGGLGRSNHALFGDACLISALMLCGLDGETPDSPVTALATRVLAQQRKDGLIWLDPAGPHSGGAAWDTYMHLSVYNAWFGALIGLADWLGPISKTARDDARITWRGARTGCFIDERAGLLCLRPESGGALLLATTGQAPQSFSRDEVELRYAGGVVLHMRAPHDAASIAPPLRVTREVLAASPALGGWTPVLECGETLWGVTDFERTSILHDNATLHVELAGQPCALTRTPPSTRREQLVAALDWRFFHGELGRDAALHRPSLKGVNARVRLTIPYTLDVIRVELELITEIDLTLLNPHGHLLCDTSEEGSPAPSSLPHARASSSPPLHLDPGTHRFAVNLRQENGHWVLETE